jgi:hypothetical protein
LTSHGSNTDFTMIAAHPCSIRGSVFPSSAVFALPATWVRTGCFIGFAECNGWREISLPFSRRERLAGSNPS